MKKVVAYYAKFWFEVWSHTKKVDGQWHFELKETVNSKREKWKEIEMISCRSRFNLVSEKLKKQEREEQAVCKIPLFLSFI